MLVGYELFTLPERTQVLLNMVSKSSDYWTSVVRSALEYDYDLVKNSGLVSLYFERWLASRRTCWQILVELQSKYPHCILC